MFLFACLYVHPSAPQVTHRFEAEANDPLLATNQGIEPGDVLGVKLAPGAQIVDYLGRPLMTAAVVMLVCMIRVSGSFSDICYARAQRAEQMDSIGISRLSRGLVWLGALVTGLLLGNLLAVSVLVFLFSPAGRKAARLLTIISMARKMQAGGELSDRWEMARP